MGLDPLASSSTEENDDGDDDTDGGADDDGSGEYQVKRYEFVKTVSEFMNFEYCQNCIGFYEFDVLYYYYKLYVLIYFLNCTFFNLFIDYY